MGELVNSTLVKRTGWAIVVVVVALNLWLLALVLLPSLPASEHLQWLGYGAAGAYGLLAWGLSRLRSAN